MDKENRKCLLEAQLCQISGITEQKARAITKNYPTLNDLIIELESKGVDNFAKIEITVGVGVRQKQTNVGLGIAKKLYDLYCE